MPSYLESKASNWSEKTVSDESYTLWFHVSSKVKTFIQIRTALVGRPYRENECIGNCRESKGISKNCSSRPLSEQYFSDTIHWQNTNSSNLSNNWLVAIHPRNRTYTQKLSKNINFWEPPNKHNPLLDAIHRSSLRNQLAGRPSDLVSKSMKIADLPSFWPIRFALFSYFYVFGDSRNLDSQVCSHPNSL